MRFLIIFFSIIILFSSAKFIKAQEETTSPVIQYTCSQLNKIYQENPIEYQNIILEMSDPDSGLDFPDCREEDSKFEKFFFLKFFVFLSAFYFYIREL